MAVIRNTNKDIEKLVNDINTEKDNGHWYLVPLNHEPQPYYEYKQVITRRQTIVLYYRQKQTK